MPTSVAIGLATTELVERLLRFETSKIMNPSSVSAATWTSSPVVGTSDGDSNQSCPIALHNPLIALSGERRRVMHNHHLHANLLGRQVTDHLQIDGRTESERVASDPPLFYATCRR